MLPSLVQVAAFWVDDDNRVADAFMRGVSQAWRASGRYDGLWLWLDDRDLTVWAPGEPIAAALP